MTLLEARGLAYDYPDGHRALRGIDLALEEGARVAVVGANGSGKSTLLLLLSGCLSPKAGGVVLRGEAAKPDALREEVGLVFQEPDDQLFMPTVLEDVAFGLVARGIEQGEAKRRAVAELERFGIAHLAERPPHRLSGGEKRVAALCGILATQPEVVALDEPSSSLDPRARRRLIEILRTLDRTLVVATHDLDMALELCDTVLLLNEGKSAALGATQGLLSDEKLLRENGLELPLSLNVRSLDYNLHS